MRIFWLEVKKLLNWKILLILAIFSGLFFVRNFIFISDASYLSAEIEISSRMLEKYGPTVDAADCADFKETLFAEYREKLNALLFQDKDCQTLKVNTIEECFALFENSSKDRNLLMNTMMKLKDNSTELGKAYSLYATASSVAAAFGKQAKSANLLSEAMHIPKEKQTETGEISVLPSNVIYLWQQIVMAFGIFLMAAVTAANACLLTAERRSRVFSLAAVSRKGRAVVRTRLAAAVLVPIPAALLFAALAASVALSPLRGSMLFLGCDISSLSGYPAWDGVTLGQFFLYALLLDILLAEGCVFAAFALSPLCRNYVTALAVHVPYLSLMTMFGMWLFRNRVTERFDASRLMPCAAFAAAACAACIWYLHREQKRDVPA